MEGKRAPLQLLLTLSMISVAVCSPSYGFLRSIALRNACNPTLACNEDGVSPGDYVADPKDCHKFYVCVIVGGDMVASDSSVSCPDGQFFDSGTRLCTAETAPCTLPCESSCSLTCTMEYQPVGFPGDCSKYYVCVLGNDKVEADCPVETPYFNGATCTNSETSCCDFCTPICYESNVQIPDPQDCHKYYICLEEGPPNESTHFTCSSGAVYDPFLGGCVEGTTCEPLCSDNTPLPTSTTSTGTTQTITSTVTTETTTSPGTTETTTSTVTTETTTSPGTTETTTSTGTTETTTSTGTTTTTDPGSGQTTTVGNDCPSTYTCRQDGNFPRCPYCDPTYFSCEGGVAQIETCSGGTVFNTNPSFPVCVAANNCPYP